MEAIHEAAFLTYRAASAGRLARAFVTSSDELLQIVRVSAGQTLVDLRAPATFEFLIRGMDHVAEGVQITSAISLGKLGETRAIPVLQNAADKRTAAVAAAASDAILRIKKANPDTMTLLRGASANGQHDSLLRPASDAGSQATDILLRPVQLPPGPDHETVS
jgi:HEAT repeat protein